jgi:hypothetical protein
VRQTLLPSGEAQAVRQKDKGSPDMLKRILDTLKELLRKINLKSLVIIFSVLIALYAFFVLRSNLEISIKDGSPTVLLKGRDPTSVVVLLPASKLWLDTGLVVKQNQEVKISASGFIHPAIHRLVDSAKIHKPLVTSSQWLDPQGDTGRSRPIDELRKPYMIADAPHGCLIAGIMRGDQGLLTKDHKKPDEIFVIGRGATIRSHIGGQLWLVVNETVLNAQAEGVYVATQKILNESYPPAGSVTVAQKRQQWEEIKKYRYFEAFFDDNVGEFLVQIQFAS